MGIRKTVQLILLYNILHETIPIDMSWPLKFHWNRCYTTETYQWKERLHGSTLQAPNCCAFSTSISHTSTFVEGGPRPYIWMLQEIGRLVIPTSFQWGLPQSSILANPSGLMIMMGLLQGEVWSRHRGVSSLGWRICEVSNVQWSTKLESPIPWPPTVHSSLQNCPPKHGISLLLALGCPWSVKATLFLGSLELTLFHVSEPFQNAFSKPYETVWAPHDGLFVLLRTGVTGWSKLTRPTILSLNIQDFTYLFSKFERHPSPQLLSWPESLDTPLHEVSCDQTALLIENGGLYSGIPPENLNSRFKNCPDRYTTWKVDGDVDTCSLSSYPDLPRVKGKSQGNLQTLSTAGVQKQTNNM